MHIVGEHQTWDPFPPTQHVNDAGDRSAAYRAIGISAVGLGVTGLVELVIALLSGSVGLLSDALHNLADVSTSLVVFIGLRVSKRPATDTHPYGWERAEDIAGLGVALVIWISAAFAAYISIQKLINHGSTTHVGYGIAAAAVGILGNQLVARYKLRVGRRIQSTTLIADAQHSWLDAISSAGAMLGLVGVAAGLPWADAVAGLLVTGFICHVGYEVTSELVRHLMDAVEPGMLTAATASASEVAGVEHAHVRARWMGRTLVIEVEGFVASDMTVEEGEAVGHDVETAIHAAVPEARVVLWTPKATGNLTGQVGEIAK
ncbi:MAG: cation transporter [Acidimicrobiaceae bacterium]|nr:cation transporter [Acidimicrobiaceae bacterium]